MSKRTRMIYKKRKKERKKNKNDDISLTVFLYPLEWIVAMTYQSTVKQLKPRLKQVNNDERLDHQDMQDTDQEQAVQ
jgi:hypothetical protein